MKSPRFALAIPAWILFTLFFLVPVAFIAYYSFGYKPFFLTGLTIATDKLTFATVRRGALGDVPRRPSRTPCRSRSSGRSSAW